MDKELVSIITPIYNSAEFVRETADGIFSQTHKNWEWLVIDDCSTDDSMKVLEQMAAKDDRIVIIKNTENLGPGPTRNRGIQRASGKYLAFVDSDDVWFSEFLEENLKMVKKWNAGFVYSSVQRWNEDFSIRYDDFIAPETYSYKQLLKTNSIVCSTAFIDAEKYGKLYMPDIRKRQDQALWLKYLEIIPKAYGIQKPMAKYRMRTNSVSSNKLSAAKYQFMLYNQHLKFNVFKSAFYTLQWAYYGYKKYRNTGRK